jgi:predicted phage terminase large subunit-like protein
VVVTLEDGSRFACPQVGLELGTLSDLIQSWDMAFKETESSDFVVGQVWGRRLADKFLLAQVHARLDFPKTVAAVRELSGRFARAYTILIEDKANGSAVISTLQREISGIIAVNPEGGKEARVNAVAPGIEAGNVYLPHPACFPWVHEFIEECACFPNAAHDDQVDSMSQALLRYIQYPYTPVTVSVGEPREALGNYRPR